MAKGTKTIEKLEMLAAQESSCPSATNMDAINVALSTLDTVVNISIWVFGGLGLMFGAISFVIVLLTFFGYRGIKSGVKVAAREAADAEIKKWENLRQEHDDALSNAQSKYEDKISTPDDGTLENDDW